MVSRRDFISSAISSAAMITALPLLTRTSAAWGAAIAPEISKFKLPSNFGLGGVAIGNGFKATSDKEVFETLEAAWRNGVRYFDTSPFYGYGLSERRFGAFLDDKKREQFIVSTKVGRIFKASKNLPASGIWKNPSKFEYTYDYSASGVRRSIEDSLLRMGLDSIDIAFIHDLSPDNNDFKGKWREQFAVAQSGAMKELAKMRKEGIIKAWGLSVNEIEPILLTLETAAPDLCLCATQYSLIKHEDALTKLFPACDKKGVKIIVGAPLNAGFLAGVDRYDYGGNFPEKVLEKRKKMTEVARHFEVDLRTAALQFSAAPSTVAAVIPGSRSAWQVEENSRSMEAKITPDFWKELKREGLIAQNAPEPEISF